MCLSCIYVACFTGQSEPLSTVRKPEMTEKEPEQLEPSVCFNFGFDNLTEVKFVTLCNALRQDIADKFSNVNIAP